MTVNKINQSGNVEIVAGYTITVKTIGPRFTGVVHHLSDTGQKVPGNHVTNIPANSSKTFGPFPTYRKLLIEAIGVSIGADEGVFYDLEKRPVEYATQFGNIEGFTGSFALKNEDNGKVFRCDDASNVTITVPNDLMQGVNFGFIMYAAGTITLSFASGVINRSGTTSITTQYKGGSLFCAKQSATNDAAEILVGGDFT